MSDRPTDNAKEKFGQASTKAQQAKQSFSVLKGGNAPIPLTDREWGEVHLASAVHYLAWGLRDLSTGIRATYVLLEEINRKLPK